MTTHHAPANWIPMKSFGPKWLKNSRLKAESKKRTDPAPGVMKLRFRFSSMKAGTAAYNHFCFVCSFSNAIHADKRATRSCQLPPYMKPDKASAQTQAECSGRVSRNRTIQLLR